MMTPVWNRMPTLSQVLLKRATMIGMIEYCAESLPETSVI
jgi:hypothetical protein